MHILRLFTIIYRYLSSDSSPGRCLYLLLLYMPLSRGNTCLRKKKTGVFFLLMAYSNCSLFFHVSLEINDLCPPPFPLRCLADCFTFPMGNGRHLREKTPVGIMASVICFRNDPYCTTLYYAQMGINQARFIHNPYCHSHYYSFDWDTDSLIYFRQKQTFLSIKKVFVLLIVYFLLLP